MRNSLTNLIFQILTLITFSIHTLARPIVIGVDGLSASLYPPTVIGTFNNLILLHIGDRLLNDHFSSGLSGDLATSWHVDEHRMTIQFSLREDMGVFTNGTKITSEVIKDCLLKYKQLGMKSGRLRRLYTAITNIQAPNPRQLLITFSEDPRKFVRFFADPATTISIAESTQSLMFSGRYRLDEFKPNHVSIIRKTDQQKFVFLKMPFDDAKTAYTKSEVHVIPTYSYYQAVELKKMGLQPVEVRDGKLYFIALNSKSPVFQNKSAREKFRNCIDNESLNKFYEQFELLPVDSMLVLHRSQKQTKSKETCDASTFKGLHVIAQVDHRASAVLKAAVPRINFANVTELDKDELANRIASLKYDIIVIGLSMVSRDAANFARLFESGNVWNVAHYTSPTMTNYLNKLQSSNSLTDRETAIASIDLEISETNLYLPLGYKATDYFVSNSIQVENSPVGLGRGQSIFLNLDKLVRLKK
jgi:MarR-like DNA-binding transcriptional regulator SgrR of sgrS sRNA